MKKVLSILLKCSVVILIVVAFYSAFSNFLDDKIHKLYKKNEIYINHINGLPQKDKGNQLIKETLADGNMLIMGSSELASPVSQNPKNLFPNNLYDEDITLVGHAGVQNALHAMNLGANFKFLRNNDIMIVESLQWFTGTEISPDAFLSNFSELQFYEFLYNSDISKKNKNYLCERYVQIENEKKTDLNFPTLGKIFPQEIFQSNVVNKQTYILAKLYSSNNFVDKIFYQLSRPYYWLRYKVLELKDKYKAYNWLKTLDVSSTDEVVEIDWDEMYKAAKKAGKEAVTTNNLFVYDEYYTTYLEEKYDNLEDVYEDVILMSSNEWKDFKFFLSVCNDLNIEPYITIMSTNGLYYDYVGISKEERDEYYNRIEKIAIDGEFDVLSLKDFEYTPYFYCDVMHLGWKGWLYVIQNTIEHFSE